jgi:hypothetical protein
MGVILGLNAITAENVDYTAAATDVLREAEYATPTSFSVRTNIRDVSINLERATADITTRGGNGYRQVAATLAESSIDFQVVYDTTDGFFTALKASYEDSEPMDIVFADGAVGTNLTSASGGVVGVEYFRAEFVITNFSLTVNLEEAMVVDVSLQSGFTSNAPGFSTIA